MAKRWLTVMGALLLGGATAPPPVAPVPIVLRPAAVFDGVDGRTHAGWQVVVRGERIVAVGPALTVPAGARIIDLPRADGSTLRLGVLDVPEFYADIGESKGGEKRSATFDVTRDPAAFRRLVRTEILLFLQDVAARAWESAASRLLTGETAVPGENEPGIYG